MSNQPLNMWDPSTMMQTCMHAKEDKHVLSSIPDFEPFMLVKGKEQLW
jgi:hypothetical protein